MPSKLWEQNEHVLDRAVRVIIGLILLSLVLVGPKTLWGLVGLVPLMTGPLSADLLTLRKDWLGISSSLPLLETSSRTHPR